MSEAAVNRLTLVEMRARPSAFSARTPGKPRSTVVSPVVKPEGDDYATGYADGACAATAAFDIERNALQRLFSSLAVLQPEPSEELAALIAATVERLVTDIVGASPIDRDWLATRVARAISCIEEADAARTLWLHPDDAALIGDIGLAIDIRCDPVLERGSLRLDCSSGWVEDSRSAHLDALRAALGTAASS